MPLNKGLLLVMMEPPASLEEEFNDWYDTEHFPQRRALPGFENASRWACVGGWPRWLALYDMESTAALDTDAYRAVSGASSTPWSLRLLPRTIGRSRIIAEQIFPGDALAIDPARVARLLLLRFPRVPRERKAGMTAEVKAVFEGLDGLLQCRMFDSMRGADSDLWVIAEFDRHFSTDALLPVIGHVGGIGADIVNSYLPYHRG
jgi:hypothetical protein